MSSAAQVAIHSPHDPHRLGRSGEITSDPAYSRPVDVPVQVGSNSKLRRATGWAPRRTRDDIINELIHAATH